MDTSGSGGLGGSFIIGKALLAVIVITAVVFAISGVPGTGGAAREKLNTGNSYMQECIQDELGVFGNTGKAERELKKFWNETGVQPYVYMKSYDASLTGNAAKRSWAEDYYNSTFDRDDVFLFVYYSDEDAASQGYMVCHSGDVAATVMDDAAVDIFFEYVDKNQEAGLPVDESVVGAFTDASKTIMTYSKKDAVRSNMGPIIKALLKVFLVVSLVLIVALAIIIVVSVKFSKDEDEEEERQKILDAPIEPLMTEADELTEKYLKMGSEETDRKDKKDDNEQAVHSNPGV